MCGVDCSICPWSKSVQDSMSSEDYDQYKIDCKNVLGFSPTKSYQNCLGCQTPEDQLPKDSPIPLRNCTTRLCVKRNEIENCAYCSRFPCAYIKVKAVEWSREKIEKKFGKPVSDEDFNKFIEPFESFNHLKEVRSNLKPKDIVEAKTASSPVVKITPFPNNLKYSDNEIKSFRQLYKLISRIKTSTVGLEDTDLYAQQERLKNIRKHFLRFLWIFGTFADKDIDCVSLIIDAKSYSKNRRSESSLGVLSFVEEFLIKRFELMGLKCELIQLSEEKLGPKGMITPTGYLRDRYWKMKVSPIGEFTNTKILHALFDYCQKLHKKYDKRSFSYFTKADFRILIKE
jgi:hypothetical protein